MNYTSVRARIFKLTITVALGSAVTLGTLYYTRSLAKRYSSDAERFARFRAAVNYSILAIERYRGSLEGAMLSASVQRFHEEMIGSKKVAVDTINEVWTGTRLPEVKNLLTQAIERGKSLGPLEARIFDRINHNDRKGAEKIYNDRWNVEFNTLIELLEKTRNLENSAYEEALKLRDEVNASSDLAQSLLMILVSIGTAAYGFFLANSISRTLEKLGNEITATVDSVRTASTSVSKASQTLSSSTSQLAAAIDETASSMEEMSSMLGQTAQNTGTTSTVAEEALQEAARGRAVITKMLTAMDEAHSSNTRLEFLIKLMDEIKTKTKIINDIVSETRLLSFNASIEAARAGAHGKGFAVVAEEVGKLATVSGKAAEEIRTLLESSTGEVSAVVRGTQERVGAVKTISLDCESAFSRMSQSLEKIGESVRMIAAATKEQEVGVKQTNQAMAEMDQVTQQNSSSAGALASQAAHLSTGAGSLSESIQQLRCLIFGGKIPSTVTPPQPLPEALTTPAPLAQSPSPAVKAEPQVQSLKEVSRSDSRWKAA
jgi:methyl-accepting chemotaxis protein